MFSYVIHSWKEADCQKHNLSQEISQEFVEEDPENSDSLFEDAHLTPSAGAQHRNSDSAEGNVFMLTEFHEYLTNKDIHVIHLIVSLSPAQLLFRQILLSSPSLPSSETEGWFLIQSAVQWQHNRRSKKEPHMAVLMPVSGWQSRNSKKGGFTGMWTPHSALDGLLGWRVPI